MELVQQARVREPKTTERTLEFWRNRGLLPSLVRVGQEGLRPLWLYPPGAEAQLDALQRLRTKTRDPSVLLAALWYEGFNVPTSRARTASIGVLREIQEQFEIETAKVAATESEAGNPREIALRQMARTLAAKRKKGFPRMNRQPMVERTLAVETLLGLTFGERAPGEQGEDEAAAVERLMGADQGRHFRPNGARPWNEGSPLENLNEFARHSRIGHLVGLLEQAKDEELQQARDLARLLIDGVSLFAWITDSMVGRDNASGMSVLRTLEDDPFAGAAMPALVLSIMSDSGGLERIAEVTEAISGSVYPLRDAVLDFLAQSGDERQRREQLIEDLPFVQRVGVRRIIAEFASTDS